jgi:transcriptional regulator with AAA-type ATPase domain
LLGERGIGKSRLAIEQKQDDGHFIMVNCASFADDTMAESELFGYKKGAFTGATSDKVGLIKEAENGILFFDEIHSLSRRVQSKLMTALQTDENNRLHIRRLGDNKEIKVNQVKLIFASNRTIQELRKRLLPDFFDRIVQQVIELPPLRQCKEERANDWKQIWEQMKFDKDKIECPTDAKFMRWLKSLELWGNYRDLQRIAIHYHNYLVIKGSQENQDILTDDNNQPLSALEYVKEHFEKYNNPISDTEIFPCQIKYGKAQDMIKNFQHQLGEKMVEKYGSRKKAAIALGVDEKTITNWKKQHPQQ